MVCSGLAPALAANRSSTAATLAIRTAIRGNVRAGAQPGSAGWGVGLDGLPGGLSSDPSGAGGACFIARLAPSAIDLVDGDDGKRELGPATHLVELPVDDEQSFVADGQRGRERKGVAPEDCPELPSAAVFLEVYDRD